MSATERDGARVSGSASGVFCEIERSRAESTSGVLGGGGVGKLKAVAAEALVGEAFEPPPPARLDASFSLALARV